MADTICEHCGKVLHVGDYPFCGPNKDHSQGQACVISDECDVWVKNGLCNEDGTPRRYTHKSEMALEAKRRGYHNHVEHIGLQGTDKSPHTTRWVSSPVISEEERIAQWHAHEAALKGL